MDVDQMTICKECEACGICHKLYLHWNKNIDEYQGTVQERQSTLLSSVAGKESELCGLLKMHSSDLFMRTNKLEQQCQLLWLGSLQIRYPGT